MRIRYIVSKDKRLAGFNEFVAGKFPALLKEKKPELLLVAGGDGAMLHAIQEFHELNIPFIGRASGTLNFLLNEFHDDEKIINGLLEDKVKLHFQESQSIKVSVNGKVIGYAVNDVLLGDSINAYHSFSLNSEDKSFDNFEVKGTGLLVSTTLGSTAYNYNNGGRILPMDSGLWSITGVVTNRFLNDILSQQKICTSIDKGNLYIDGIKVFSSKGCYEVDLEPGKHIKIAFFDERTLHSK